MGRIEIAEIQFQRFYKLFPVPPLNGCVHPSVKPYCRNCPIITGLCNCGLLPDQLELGTGNTESVLARIHTLNKKGSVGEMPTNSDATVRLSEDLRDVRLTCDV